MEKIYLTDGKVDTSTKEKALAFINAVGTALGKVVRKEATNVEALSELLDREVNASEESAKDTLMLYKNKSRVLLIPLLMDSPKEDGANTSSTKPMNSFEK